MVPTLWLYQLLLVALVLLYCRLYVWWRDDPTAPLQTPLKPDQPQRKRSKEPRPFTGLLRQPLCAACEQGLKAHLKAPGEPPPLMLFTRGRRRTIDTQSYCCPDQDCFYYGWLGHGNLRSNGHPGGQPWRQLQCVSCHGYFSETHGTMLSRVWRKAWASEAPRGYARWTRTPSCNG